MLSPFLATIAHTSHPAPASTDDATPYHPASWGARIIPIILAVYLIPVVALMLLIGVVGMAIVGLAGLVGRMTCWARDSSDAEVEEYTPRS